MKSESRKAVLVAALSLEARKGADLERLVREFESMACDLDREIKAEEDRTRIKDPLHVAYSNFAQSARQRCDNLRAPVAGLRVNLEEAQRERDDRRAAPTRARIARPRSASTKT